MKKKELALANLEAKKHLFQNKKKIYNEIIEQALDNIHNMAEIKKKSLLKKLLEKAKKEIKVKTVYCAESEAKIVKQLAKSLTVKTAKISGGIIVENMEKSISVDLSYHSIVNDLHDAAIHKISELIN